MKLQLEKQQEQEKVSQPRGILKTKTTAVKTSSGVSSLLAGYDDSDSDAETDLSKEKSTRVSWPSEEVKLKQTRIIEPAPSEPSRKRARLETQTVGLTDERIQAIQAEMGMESATTATTNISVGNAKTESEFQALLDETNDDNMPNTEAAASDASNQQQQQASTNEEKNSTSSTDTTEIEQVSYQARIAQLRLKAAARRNKKTIGAPISTVETYTPELALGNDEEDEEENVNEKGEELTPLEILRRKRLEVKRSRECSEEQS